MPSLVCQRCGESSEGESYLLARSAMEHKLGCGPKVGPLVASSKATPKAQEHDQPEPTPAPEEPKPEEPEPEEPKPEAKKATKRKKKSE